MEQAAFPGEYWQFGREAEQRVDSIRRFRAAHSTESFGAVIKRLRQRQKMTQRAMANALHVPLRDVADLESGDQQPKSFDQILWIGAALGLNVADTNQLLRADERRELDEEERIVFIKLRLQVAYPFLDRGESVFESCFRCGTELFRDHRCPRCGSAAHL